MAQSPVSCMACVMGRGQNIGFVACDDQDERYKSSDQGRDLDGRQFAGAVGPWILHRIARFVLVIQYLTATAYRQFQHNKP